MQIQAIKVRRLYLEVAGQIKQMITSGELAPGQRLPPERDLAKKFEVSRPTIREAMIALEIDGQIEIRPGAGSFISANPNGAQEHGLPLKDEGPGSFEILEARRIIEAEAAALAAARITQEQIERLDAVFRDIEEEGNAGSVSEESDQAFHCLIAEASQNSALVSSVRWLWELRLRSAGGQLFHQRVREGGVHPSVEQHRQILLAIKNRDPLGARNAMESHLTQAISRIQ